MRCVASHRYPILTEAAPEGGDGEAEPVQMPHPLLAVGSYDGNVRLLSARSWAVAFVLPACHPSEMPAIMSQGVVTTVEVAGDSDDSTSDVFSFAKNSSK